MTGVKTWRDNGKTDRGSIELTLYRNDEEYKTLTLDGEGDAWDYTFEDLPKYDEKGALYVYEVRETDAPVSAAGDSARTGDDSPVMLYLASALLALLLAAFALLLRRRLKR